MKFYQTQNRITFKDNGTTSIIIGIILVLVGIGMLIFRNMASEANVTGITYAGIGLIIAGIICLLFVKSTTTTIEKDGDLTIRNKRILLNKEKVESVPVDEIAKIKHTVNIDTDEEKKEIIGHLTLVLKDNSSVKIAHKRKSTSSKSLGLSSFRKAPLTKESQAVGKFLGLEVETSDMSTLSSSIETIKSAFDKKQKTSK